jgi:hypothetical protein
MVRKIDPVQRFSSNVVDGAPATVSVAYLLGIYRQIGATGAPRGFTHRAAGKELSCDGAAQSRTLKRPCRAPDISRENCAWLM